MTLTLTQIIDRIIWLITVFLLASFQIFDQFEWGKYSFIVCSFAILILSAIRNNWRLKIRFELYYLFFLLFAAYIAINSIWSQNSSETLTMARTCIRIWFCFSVLYLGYSNSIDLYMMLSAFLTASYIISVYSTFYFGFKNVFIATHEARLDSGYANINSIATFLAMGIVIEIYMFLIRGFKIYSILSFLSMLFLMASQSRKAIIMLLFGVLALIILHNSNKKGVFNRIFRILFIIICFATFVYFISKLLVFSGVNHRIDMWINSILGNSKADRSSILRNDFITLGLKWWAKYPIGGVGIATTHILSQNEYHVNWYLHNNYVELLCGGGIFAIALYYSMHISLIIRTLRLRKTDYAVFTIVIVLLGLILLTDFGRVSYYSKTIMFEITMLFVIVQKASKGRGDIEVVE